MRAWMLVAFALGCVDPLVDDTVPVRADEAFPQGPVPTLADRPELLAQVDLHDGVDRIVPRLSAFADGERVWYWSFGPAPATAIPLYYLARWDDQGELTPIPEHPVIFDSVPGDDGYSPFWEIWYLPVTDRYQGEQLTSFAAVQSARALGLLHAPVETGLAVNCPVVHPDVRLETKSGLEEPFEGYYRGIRVPLFSFEAVEVEDGAFPTAEVFRLRREGGEILDESWRNVDMTGDGDINDTNTVFRMGVEAPDYTPLWQVVEVVVPADYASIDTHADETQADYRDAGDMFAEPGLSPRTGKVVAFQVQSTLVNCPIAQGDR